MLVLLRGRYIITSITPVGRYVDSVVFKQFVGNMLDKYYWWYNAVDVLSIFTYTVYCGDCLIVYY